MIVLWQVTISGSKTLFKVDDSVFDQTMVSTGGNCYNISDHFGHGSKVDMLTAIS